MSKADDQRRKEALWRIAQIRQEISRLDLLCSGTLLRRTKVCGKTACRCAQDFSERHGPYYEWSRRQGNRLVHTILSKDEAERLAQAIRNYRLVKRLLRRWERETFKVIRAEEPAGHP